MNACRLILRCFCALLLALMLCLPAEAARLFTSGLETNDGSSGTLTEWTAGSTGTFDNTVQHSGTYSGKVLNASAQIFRHNMPSNRGEGTTICSRVYWRGSSTSSNRIMRWADGAGASVFIIEVVTGGAVRLRNIVAGTSYDTGNILSTNTWYRFEWSTTVSDTVGASTIDVYAGNSTTLLGTQSFSGEDTLITGTGIRDLLLQNSSGAGSTFWYDDVAINDTTGSFQTGCPGPANIDLAQVGDDTAVAWTKGGTPAATNWQGVTSIPAAAPDDATTYNADSGATNEDRMVVAGLPAGVPSDATLILVDVYGRVASTGSGTMALKVWDQVPTGTEGPTFTVNSGTWRILTSAEHQPYNLSGVTKGLFEQYSLGYIAKSNTSGEKRITELWANVEWLEAAAGGGGTNFYRRRVQ